MLTLTQMNVLEQIANQPIDVISRFPKISTPTEDITIIDFKYLISGIALAAITIVGVAFFQLNPYALSPLAASSFLVYKSFGVKNRETQASLKQAQEINDLFNPFIEWFDKAFTAKAIAIQQAVNGTKAKDLQEVKVSLEKARNIYSRIKEPSAWTNGTIEPGPLTKDEFELLRAVKNKLGRIARSLLPEDVDERAKKKLLILGFFCKLFFDGITVIPTKFKADFGYLECWHHSSHDFKTYEHISIAEISFNEKSVREHIDSFIENL